MEFFTDLSDRASEQLSGGNKGVGALGNAGEPQTGGYFNGNGNNPHAAGNPDADQPGNDSTPGNGGNFNPNNPHFNPGTGV